MGDRVLQFQMLCSCFRVCMQPWEEPCGDKHTFPSTLVPNRHIDTLYQPLFRVNWIKDLVFVDSVSASVSSGFCAVETSRPGHGCPDCWSTDEDLATGFSPWTWLPVSVCRCADGLPHAECVEPWPPLTLLYISQCSATKFKLFCLYCFITTV